MSAGVTTGEWPDFQTDSLMAVALELIKRWDANGFYAMSHEDLVNSARRAVAKTQAGMVEQMPDVSLRHEMLMSSLHALSEVHDDAGRSRFTRELNRRLKAREAMSPANLPHGD